MPRSRYRDRTKVLVSRAEWRVSLTAGCSRFYVNVVSTRKTGYLAHPWFMLIILAACLHDEQHGESADAAPSPPRTRRSLFAPYDRQVDVDKLQPSIAATVMLYVDNLPSLTAHVRLAQSSWTVLKEDARCVKLHKLQERNPLRSCNVYSR